MSPEPESSDAQQQGVDFRRRPQNPSRGLNRGRGRRRPQTIGQDSRGSRQNLNQLSENQIAPYETNQSADFDLSHRQQDVITNESSSEQVRNPTTHRDDQRRPRGRYNYRGNDRKFRSRHSDNRVQCESQSSQAETLRENILPATNSSSPATGFQRRFRGRTTNLRERFSNEPSVYLNQSETIENHNVTNQSGRHKSLDSSSQTANAASNIQSEIAEDQLKSNNFECMICCDNIHRSNSIWYCVNCYNIFHLKCAIEWCNKSIKSRDEAIANAQYPTLGLTGSTVNDPPTHPRVVGSEGYADYRGERLNSVEWPCPACRKVLYTRPNKYKCFCGKVVRPEVSKHLTPHSCGQLCGRKRPNADCPHTCNSLCHPGRCMPCPLTSRKPCFCGKLTREIKCSVGTTSCDQTCGKPLACGSHFCSKVCHSGPCGTCDEILTIRCNCGRETIQERCADRSKSGKEGIKSFSCEQACSKLLACGKHYCTEKCHPQPNCSECKLLSKNIRTCPCGSTLIKKALLLDRKSCTDPLPTCENKCNRPLICGPEKNRHRCQKKCHGGPCPPCKLKTSAYCQCKLSTKTIECSLMYEKQYNDGQLYFKQTKFTFACETRCNTLKNCGRHRCNSKCCNFIKNSSAPIHRCDQICNKKLPCGVHNCPEVCHQGQCGDCTNIGWEELTCHCGSSVLYPPIPCGAKQPACHRPCRRAHSCGHPVKHECHDDSEKCAPCTVFVKKSCFCGADSKESVYCYLPGYSCGRTCKKQLKCRMHTCKRVCHDNQCETPDERGVILCNQPCTAIRYSCKHPCGQPCHGKTPCHTSQCRKLIEIKCECGNKVERMECFKVMRDVDNINKVTMLSTNKFNQDTIMVDLSKKSSAHAGIENNPNLKKLDCDETCSIFKRNKALAEALDIAQPDLKPTSVFGEDPLRLLKEATAQDYKFVAATFNSLARFVKSAKESDKRFIFMQFPPASKLRREVVHELAYHFNCTSESREEEPFRHVVVRAYKNKSCVPDFSIEQLLPVSEQ